MRGLAERPTGTLGVLVARPMGRAKPRARPRGLAGDHAAQTPILTGLCAICREHRRTPEERRARKAKPARFRGPVRSSPIGTGSNRRIRAVGGVLAVRSLVNRTVSDRREGVWWGLGPHRPDSEATPSSVSNSSEESLKSDSSLPLGNSPATFFPIALSIRSRSA